MNTITYSVGLTEGREARCFLFSVFKMAILVTLVKIPTNLWKDQLPKTDGHLHRQNPLPAHGVEAKLTKKTNLKIQSNWLTDKKNMLFISESSPCMWSGKDLWTCPVQPKPRWRPLANEPGNGHDQDGYNIILIKIIISLANGHTRATKSYKNYFQGVLTFTCNPRQESVFKARQPGKVELCLNLRGMISFYLSWTLIERSGTFGQLQTSRQVLEGF